MNNTIFRRKIVFGVLIAFVLGFGVQGVAEAQFANLNVTSPSGDLQVKRYATNQTFEFSFSISGVPSSAARTGHATESSDRESISIALGTDPDVDGWTIDEVRVGSTRFEKTTPDKTFTLTERIDTETTGGDGKLTNNRIYVTVMSTTPGSATVTVSPALASVGDIENLRFTAYATRPPATVQNLRFAAATNDGTVNPTTKTTFPNETDDPLHDEIVEVRIIDSSAATPATDVGNSAWAVVDFEVIEGPGFVYQDLNDDSQPDPGENRISKTATTLTRLESDTDVNNVAKVRLRTNGGTNKVQASIRYTNPLQKSEVTYIFQGVGTTTPPPPPQGASLTVSAPDGTAGQTITVSASVSDRAGDRTVTFSSSRGGTFSPASASVQTASNGVATIQFTLPSTTGPVTIDASATGYTTLPATVQVSSAIPSFIVTPSPIIGAPAGDTYSIVINAGAPNILVTLSGTGFQSAQGRTLANGSVTIFIVLPNTPGTYSLFADAPGYAQTLIPVTVIGSTTPTTDVPVELTIPSGQTQTVSIGNNAPLRVRVTRTGTTTGQSGVTVTFRNASGTTIHTADTVNGEITYNFPVNILGPHTVSATLLAANNSNFDVSGITPVTFTITGTRQQPTQSARITILQPVDGSGQTLTETGPGASYPLTILMTTVNGAAAVNQVITLTVENAAQTVVSSTTLITGANGRATTQDTFRLPTAPGVYTIKATSGTEFREITVTVVAIRLVKDASDSVSGDNQEGDRGVVLDDPFLLKVVRDIANVETAVQGVPVTFTIVDGDGELSTSSGATSGSNSITVNSDTNGDVRAYLVLGEDEEDNRVRASVGITTVPDVFFDATGALVPDDLEIVSGNNQRIAVNRRSDPMRVLVTDEDGDALEGVTVTFSLRGGSGTLTPRSAETNRFGEAEAELLPRAAGTYTITARVVGVQSVTFTITVGDLADDIEIVSGNNQRGDTGTQLTNPLVVEVLDDDDDPVSGVTVTFSVTAGGGSLSDTSVDTNNRGRAQTTLTLGDSPGRNTVRASVSGVSTRVTFTATAVDPAPPEPVIHLGSGQRVDTYWINRDSGTLHRLVGSNVENIAPGVENVVSLVVTSNRLYWVETTSATTGRLRRSNLNGSNIQLIRDLTALPAGITVDTVNSKIYLTNGFGKVQSINLDGSGYAPNLITGLTNPKDIAVGGGKVYWITDGGTVHSANVDGSGVTQIAGGYSALGSIAVGGGKVFWTETINESDGNIHSANLDNSSVTEVVSLLAAPYGISVDAGANKLYFTNSRGRLMQSNLNGGSIKIVASNLVAPGDVAVSSGTTAPRPPGTFSRYDVNRDGTVDNTDAALVANALGESPPSNPRLDVNGDGVVNFLDLLLVFDNRDESNAAPVAVASERPKVSPEEVQHQIEQLLATDNHSATAQFTLAYLQSLLEVVTPEQTRLLANYPNPFNPETWIPYQLAASSEVQITIYNSAGKEVRTLSLGHQSEGYYTDRSRAAYWDGRNAIGEQVASGVYFYTLITDRMSATRKMLILK